MGLERWHALMCGLVLLALWEDTVHLVLSLSPTNGWYYSFFPPHPYHLYKSPLRVSGNASWWVWITFVTESDLIGNHFECLTFDILFCLTQAWIKQWLYLTLNLPFSTCTNLYSYSRVYILKYLTKLFPKTISYQRCPKLSEIMSKPVLVRHRSPFLTLL